MHMHVTIRRTRIVPERVAFSANLVSPGVRRCNAEYVPGRRTSMTHRPVIVGLLLCCILCTVCGQVSVKSLTSQVQNGHLTIVATLSRWQGNFTYQLTVPAGLLRAQCCLILPRGMLQLIMCLSGTIVPF